MRAEASGYIVCREIASTLTSRVKDKYWSRWKTCLVPSTWGQTVKLNNIFFQQSNISNTTSYPELARPIRIMKEYPSVEIKISGHTDNRRPLPQPKTEPGPVNQVKKYLSSHGVNGGRITTAEGFMAVHRQQRPGRYPPKTGVESSPLPRSNRSSYTRPLQRGAG
jgi:hypothetical protein